MVTASRSSRECIKPATRWRFFCCCCPTLCRLELTKLFAYIADSSTVLKFDRIVHYRMCVRWWMFKIQHDKLCAKIENKILFSSLSLSLWFSNTIRMSFFFLFCIYDYYSEVERAALACLFVQQTHKLCHTLLNYNVNCNLKRRKKNTYVYIYCIIQVNLIITCYNDYFIFFRMGHFLRFVFFLHSSLESIRDRLCR